MEDFSLFIKQCYRIVWSVEKIQKVKTQNFHREKNERKMMLSNSEVCNCKKSRFIKEQGNSRLLSRLEIKIPLIHIFVVQSWS